MSFLSTEFFVQNRTIALSYCDLTVLAMSAILDLPLSIFNHSASTGTPFSTHVQNVMYLDLRSRCVKNAIL